jgi:hypothetical protein
MKRPIDLSHIAPYEAVKYDIRLHLYALELVVMLLIPLAVALAALAQWRAGDFRTSSAIPTVKEIS